MWQGELGASHCCFADRLTMLCCEDSKHRPHIAELSDCQNIMFGLVYYNDVSNDQIAFVL